MKDTAHLIGVEYSPLTVCYAISFMTHDGWDERWVTLFSCSVVHKGNPNLDTSLPNKEVSGDDEYKVAMTRSGHWYS